MSVYGRDPVLFELGLEEREGQLRAEQRDVLPPLEQVRHGADVVLVAVREHDADDVVEAVPDRREVGEDQVDAWLVLLGEEHAAVDDEQPAVVLEDGHVAADLAESAERDDAEAPLRQCGRCGELGMWVAQKTLLTTRATYLARHVARMTFVQ